MKRREFITLLGGGTVRVAARGSAAARSLCDIRPTVVYACVK
jgi:hypothetical protein